MASDKKQCIISGTAKCYEFIRLGYPSGILRYMCAKLAYINKNTAWFAIRQSLPPSINYNSSNINDYKSNTTSP